MPKAVRNRARRAPKHRRRFVVRRSSIHGLGVFALVPIPKRSRVIEYKGMRISHEEADDLFGEEQANSPHTMLFTVNDEIVIDATRKGNSARWINHSCRPNCETVDEKDRIFIEAIRDIRPGEELSYDYNLQLAERHTKKAKREHACFCGSRRCRGTMLGEKE
ncbi:MAG TPA: SET domain-containing protein-lysine N-methyltransferase [Candidatus Binatia bacterium]